MAVFKKVMGSGIFFRTDCCRFGNWRCFKTVVYTGIRGIRRFADFDLIFSEESFFAAHAEAPKRTVMTDLVMLQQHSLVDGCVADDISTKHR